MDDRRKVLTERTALLLGEDGLNALEKSRVAVVGLGGVGGICAEALARAGVGSLHLVDADVVAESNCNRQIFATLQTVGQKKTEAAAERIRAVSLAEVTVSDLFVTPGNVEEALPGTFDFIVDAIDSVPGKTAVALFCRERNIPMISCLGAGNRRDPSRLTVTDLFLTQGCPLARRMRIELRKAGISAMPVVFSSEPACKAPGQTEIGSLVTVTSAAGLLAADYALKRLLEK